MGAGLLVADQDVAQLRVVQEDVVQGEYDAARVAEDDVDALAQERLAQDVRAGHALPVGPAVAVLQLVAGRLVYRHGHPLVRGWAQKNPSQ